MDRSLWLLLRLRVWAWVRRRLRGFRTAKGVLLAVVGSLVFMPMIGSFFLAPRIMIGTQLQAIRAYGPLALLAYCVLNVLLSSGDRAIYYSPAEVGLLFCGPYRPRQLLVYKVVGATGAALLTAILMALALSHHAALFVSAFAGLFLTVELIYLFSLACGLTVSTVGALASGWGRRVVLAGLISIGAVALWPIGREALTLPVWEVVARVLKSPTVSVVLAPFRPFVNAFTAERLWPDLLLWSGLALGVNLVLLALVLFLNDQFLEAAAAASVRVYERARRGHQGVNVYPGGKARFPVPMLPWWGGVGPNLWRQLTTASRSPGQFLALVALFMFPVVLYVLQESREQGNGFGAALPFFFMVSLFTQSTVGFDFRPDYRRMDNLKVLPIGPARLALSQLLTPVILVSVAEWIALVVIARVDPSSHSLVAAAAALAVPLNLLLSAIENLYFLWYPYRNVGANSVDIQTIGRQMLLMLAKATSVAAAGALAAGVATVVYLYAGQNWTATVAAAAAVVTGSGLALVPLLAHAFVRFDVARDTPE